MEELPQILKHNPGLQSINLEFSEIESLDPILPLLIQFTELKELLLFGNRLETLPKDLSRLKALEKLDISNNLIADIENILPGLISIQNLKELHITLQDHQDEEMLTYKLPNLQSLNGNIIEKNLEFCGSEQDFNYDDKEIGKTLLACESSGFFAEENSLSQDYLEKIANLYDEIRAVWAKEDKNKDELLAADFDEGLKSIMGELSEVLKKGHEDFIVNVYSMKAKYELALICQRKISDLVLKKNEKVGQKLLEVQEVLGGIFQENIKNLLGLQPKLQKKMKNLKAEVELAQLESAEVLEAADQLQKESERHQHEKAKLLQIFHEERAEFLAEIESLQEENKRYLDTIIRHSKSYAESAISSRSIEAKELEDDKKKFNSTGGSGKSSGKVLSLRQIKDVIEEIYASKVKFDEKCTDGKLPRETMEQHMYNFLNKKYGLKTLVMDWAASIATSVKRYSAEDSDVAVFGQIVRNECDEEFRFVQVQVKKTAGELLRMNLKNKFPLKSAADINDIASEKIAGFLNEEEWTEIVRFMYNDLDAEFIIEQLYNLRHTEESLSDRPMSKGKVSREEMIILKEKEKTLKNKILYSDFLNFLLEFQLQEHEKYLKNFVRAFKKIDSNADGVLSEEEFKKLIGALNLGFDSQDCNRLLQIIDPFDNQQISFTECVALFASELIPVENIPIMQKISKGG